MPKPTSAWTAGGQWWWLGHALTLVVDVESVPCTHRVIRAHSNRPYAGMDSLFLSPDVTLVEDCTPSN